ncbi:hypothetical protein TCRASSO_20165 [Tenacibaculum crassostreae]
MERFQKENSDKLYFEKSTSKEELEEIRHKTKRRNQRELIKNIAVLFILFIILFFLISSL